MRTRYRNFAIALAAVAVLTLTACGDDDDGPTATPKDAATDAPTASGSFNPTSPARNQDASLACAAITLSDVVVALGVSADTVEVTDEGAVCTYVAGDTTLTVEVAEEASAEGADATVEESAGEGDPIEVGTVAYQDGGTVTASHLNYVITYTLEPADDAQLLALGRNISRFQPSTPTATR